MENPLTQTQLELVGARFGKLVVVSEGRRDRWRNRLYECRCDCGETTYVKAANLRSENTRSCGCSISEHISEAMTIHGHGNESPTFRSWSSMWTRCTNPRSINWEYYGGRGIKVCDRWGSFANFLADMGERPSLSMTLDRIDNDGDYDPTNCRWATHHEQATNRRAPKGSRVHG